MGRHSQTRRAFRVSQLCVVVLLVVGALATLIGVWKLWPPATEVEVSDMFANSSALAMPRVEGVVTSAEPGNCASPSYNKAFDGQPLTAVNRGELCPRAVVAIKTGDNAGKNTLIRTEDFALHDGQKIWLNETAGATGETTYVFADIHRGTPLLWWLLIIAGCILVVATLRGLLALVGLAITFLAVGGFLIPSLLHGGSPVWLAVTSGAAILYLTLFLVHGVSWKTASALCGTLIALVIAALTSQLAIRTTNLQGLGNEDNLLIRLYLPNVSVVGLMLCGFIIGALGVLNDVTVAQAATVQELYETSPDASPYEVFAAGMRVGRDHIASMVYTLVLSYTGAALPVMLLLHVADRPLVQTLTGDLMATELLRSGIGALALVTAVPITTAIAALTVKPTP